MAKKYDKNTWMGGDIDPKEIAREQDAPEKDMKKQTRGWTKAGSRKQKEPTSKGFLKHTQKGKC